MSLIICNTGANIMNSYIANSIQHSENYNYDIIP